MPLTPEEIDITFIDDDSIEKVQILRRLAIEHNYDAIKMFATVKENVASKILSFPSTEALLQYLAVDVCNLSFEGEFRMKLYETATPYFLRILESDLEETVQLLLQHPDDEKVLSAIIEKDKLEDIEDELTNQQPSTRENSVTFFINLINTNPHFKELWKLLFTEMFKKIMLADKGYIPEILSSEMFTGIGCYSCVFTVSNGTITVTINTESSEPITHFIPNQSRKTRPLI